MSREEGLARGAWAVGSNRRTARRIVALCAAALSALALPLSAAEKYRQASVDPAGRLLIATEDGREIVQHKEAEQVGFDQVAIAQDGRSVGWLALYPNCCTSYPIPLKLVIYSSGRLWAFTGRGLPVWRWRFKAGARQVAFEQETVHGGLGIHYEWRDVATGRLIAEYDPAVGAGNRTIKAQDVPKWVEELDAAAGSTAGVLPQ